MPSGIYKRKPLKIRFESHAKQIGDCLVWQGHKNKEGYGIFWYKGKGVKAHRMAFAIENGYFSKNCILHKCDNPPCVSTSHLFEGTQQDNVADRQLKGRTHRGENTGGVKLNERKVLKMRELAFTKCFSVKQLALMFNEPYRRTRDAIERRSWKYI